MSKWMPLLLGLAPTITSIPQTVLQISVSDKIKYTNDDVNNLDDWDSPVITIDFSTVGTIQSSGYRTFDLEISKKLSFTPTGKRKIKIQWRTRENGKWSRKETESRQWVHKGFWLGEMIDDFINDDQIVLFKNLSVGHSLGYDLEQPDFMLSQLFMFTYKIPFAYITERYVNPSWFIAISAVDWEGHNPYEEYVRMSKKANTRVELNKEFFSDLKKRGIAEAIYYSGFEAVMKSTVFEAYDKDVLWEHKFLNIEKK